ncbi:MAG TPA: GNAT family N-acetyltransferase [Chitinophagaceae bacterium]|nr:GNAT family N-acetyltransferase [Chitinophagaceae bacterium]
MIKAEYTDRAKVVNILTHSFDDNKSVNYIIKQDDKRVKRIRNLMEYSFDVCYLFGEVFLTEDKRGCALIVIPEKKKTTLKAILLDIKLIIYCIGLSNIGKAMSRESKIKKLQPKERMYYLWFIGVDPISQNNGVGSMLLSEIITESVKQNRSIYLETSTLKNIPWYEKFGFKIYNELDVGYRLFFLKREAG